MNNSTASRPRIPPLGNEMLKRQGIQMSLSSYIAWLLICRIEFLEK